jgi:hypothetical protein
MREGMENVGDVEVRKQELRDEIEVLKHLRRSAHPSERVDLDAALGVLASNLVDLEEGE